MPSTKDPSRNDVELALKALEIEDEREKEAIRLFWERQRQERESKHVGVWRWMKDRILWLRWFSWN